VPPTFRKSPPGLVARFTELAAELPAASGKQMFGYPTLVTGGNMFMGLHQDALILRLSEPDRAEFVDGFQAAVFEPIRGRPMREYIVVPPALLDDPAPHQWIDWSFTYARQLPTKTAKTPNKK
jgi:TfoX/Sxy family transcriptional regulator of competence genes